MAAQAKMSPPVTPPTTRMLQEAVQQLVADHKENDPLLKILPDMVKAVANRLGLPEESWSRGAAT